MKRFGVLFCCLLLVSCNWLTSKNEVKENLIQKELDAINWNDVDRYPLFEDCDETLSREEQKRCFQNGFNQHFLKSLQQQPLVVHQNLNDTLKVQLLIGKDGEVSILQIKKSKRIAEQIPEIDTLIAHSVETLPKVYPALKRDIPVNMKIQMPIILKAGAF